LQVEKNPAPAAGAAAAAGAKRDSVGVAEGGEDPKRHCAVGTAAGAGDQPIVSGKPDGGEAGSAAALGMAEKQATTPQLQQDSANPSVQQTGSPPGVEAPQGSDSPASAAEASGSLPQPAAQPASAYDRLRQQLDQAKMDLSNRNKALADAKKQPQARGGQRVPVSCSFVAVVQRL
jgi:hypothetical protein